MAKKENIYQEVLNKEIKSNARLAAGIRSELKLGSRTSSDEAFAFIITYLKLKHGDLSKDELKQIITDGWNDAGIDAIYLFNNNIFIYDFKDGNFNYSEIVNKFISNSRRLLFRTSSISGLNSRLVHQIKQVRQCERNSNPKYHFFVIRKSLNKSEESIINQANSFKSCYSSIKSFTLLNTKDIVKLVVNASKDDFKKNWDLKIACTRNETDNDFIILKKRNSISTLIARVPLKQLIILAKTCKDEDYNLYDKNVRDFRNKGELSNGFIETLKTYPDKFHIFHNGITVSCKKISRQSDEKFKIFEPQIINGCQTVNSLYREFKDNLNSSRINDSATLFCRFYVLKEGEFIEKVCQTSNTQIKIEPWELRSNDNIQFVLEYVINNIIKKDFKYKRKKSSKSLSRDIISLSELGQWYYACKFKNPAFAKNKKKEIFELVSRNSIYKNLYNPKDINIKDIRRICSVGLFVKEESKKLINKRKLSSFSKKDELIIAKSGNFHLMTALFYSRKKLSSVNFEKILKIVISVVKNIRKIEGHDYSIYKIFTQRTDTWDVIRNKLKRI